MNLVLLGAPGAGKGTQAAAIHDSFKCVHVSSGDLLRAEKKKGSELGKKAAFYMEAGKLVPDDLVIAMILDRLTQPDCSRGIMLDGFPRSTVQAEALDKAFAKEGKKIDWALYIDVPAEDLVARITGRWSCEKCGTPYHQTASPPKVKGICDKCGGKLSQRADDTEATVRLRLKTFFDQTMPVIEFYRKQRKLLEVDGTKNISAVTVEVIKVLGKVQGK
jgi:adenylate kinase